MMVQQGKYSLIYDKANNHIGIILPQATVPRDFTADELMIMLSLAKILCEYKETPADVPKEQTAEKAPGEIRSDMYFMRG